MNPVVVDGLTKVFGTVRAVDGISFEVRPGEIFGLLGPNGAGKTTSLRVLAGLIRPTRGIVRVFRQDVAKRPKDVRACLGFLATETGLYERLTPMETLAFFGRIFGLPESRIRDRSRELLSLLGLWELRRRRVGVLSVGERQKLSFARCLMHDPPLLILDEPTAGLDVFVARAAVALILELRRSGKTVLLSTHDMHLAERLCGRVGIMHHGQLAAAGEPAALCEELGADDLTDAFFCAVRKVGLSPEQAKVVR